MRPRKRGTSDDLAATSGDLAGPGGCIDPPQFDSHIRVRRAKSRTNASCSSVSTTCVCFALRLARRNVIASSAVGNLPTARRAHAATTPALPKPALQCTRTRSPRRMPSTRRAMNASKASSSDGVSPLRMGKPTKRMPRSVTARASCSTAMRSASAFGSMETTTVVPYTL
eukprot:Amastigsp_a508661_17.p4 type:complete len:170 gc:universal Amastigsp_a508661_17:754-245(-)